jgi:hypothetical protein
MSTVAQRGTARSDPTPMIAIDGGWLLTGGARSTDLIRVGPSTGTPECGDVDKWLSGVAAQRRDRLVDARVHPAQLSTVSCTL